MERYRVVQWTTGNVGKRALRAILDREEFDVVGVYAFSPDKVGRDAGTLAGAAPVGVLATDDVDALLAATPDCVLYTPRVIDYPFVVRLLRRGINVVTTGDFLTGTHHPTSGRLSRPPPSTGARRSSELDSNRDSSTSRRAFCPVHVVACTA